MTDTYDFTRLGQANLAGDTLALFKDQFIPELLAAFDAKRVMKEIRKIKNYNGRVILMHGIYSSTLDAVKILIPELLEKGYQFVTVSEMAAYKGTSLKAGKIYYNFR